MERKSGALPIAAAALAGAVLQRLRSGGGAAEEATVAPPTSAYDPRIPRSQLYRRAKALGIEGRSSMPTEDLAQAVADHASEGVST